MEQEVIDALREAFPGIEVELEVMSNGRLFGSVIWSGFDGLDQVDRQDCLRQALQKKLGERGQHVGVLLTYTPDEIKAMRAA